jgi:hypothetical protein
MPETVAPAPAEPATRRCWRCLQMFPGDAAWPSAREDFWLCDPCGATLLPDRRRPS